MTETGQSTAPSADPPPRSCLRKKGACLVIVFILAVALVAASFFCPWLLKMRDGASPDLSQADRKLVEVEQQIQAIHNRLDDLDVRIGKETTNTSAVQDQENPAVVQTLAHVQSDLAALSSAVAGLQVEVKQAGSSVAATQQATQASLASAIAYIQLRAAAEAGRGFASELTALRRAAPDDSQLREILENLKPYADKGVPTLVVLREEFMSLEASASAAVDRSTAQNWWQRLLAELKGLVSIRPLHGGDATGAIATAENAINAGNLNEAVAVVKTLPQDAQDVLKDWLVKVQARTDLDTALRALSDRFAALASPVSTPHPRDEP